MTSNQYNRVETRSEVVVRSLPFGEAMGRAGRSVITHATDRPDAIMTAARNTSQIIPQVGSPLTFI